MSSEPQPARSTDPTRVGPRRPIPRVTALAAALTALVLGAVLGLGQSVSPMSVAAAEPSPPPLSSAPGSVPAATPHVPGTPGVDTSAMPTSDPAPEDFELFWEALQVVREHYVDGDALTDENLTRGAIRGMVDALGDTGHTVYLTPEQVQAEIDALDGRVIGIGISVDTRGAAPAIIAVFPGSPAAEAGLRPGDVIVSVDGRRVDRLGVSSLIERVRGEPGTTVTLGIRHPDGSREELPIVRAEVSIPPVAWAMVPGTTIADIGINQFSDGAARDTRRAVRRALDRGATGIVLDLRGNPGGLVHEAIGVARLFLPEGSPVYLEQGRDGERTPVRTRDEPLALGVPLIVLVDEGSASAAEIVAAALRDNGRARVLGLPTFGTGTVLNFFPLSDGSAIRLGVLRWLTPGGLSVFETGVEPDVMVELPAAGAVLYPEALDALDARSFRRSEDTQLRRAVRLLTTDPDGVPRPATTPQATGAAPPPSTALPQAPPSPVEAGV